MFCKLATQNVYSKIAAQPRLTLAAAVANGWFHRHVGTCDFVWHTIVVHSSYAIAYVSVVLCVADDTTRSSLDYLTSILTSKTSAAHSQLHWMLFSSYNFMVLAATCIGFEYIRHPVPSK